MSAKQMGKVWEHDFDHPEQSIMLALADHAHDDGTEIRPSVARLAWKTGYEERQVYRILKRLRDELKVLVLIKRGGGRGKSNVYCFNWTNAVKKSEFSPKRNPDIQTVNPDIEDENPDTTMSDEPSIEPSSLEPSVSTEGDASVSESAEASPSEAVESLANHTMKRIYQQMKDEGFTITSADYGKLVARVQWALDNMAPTQAELEALPEAYLRAYKIRGPATDAVYALNELRRQAAREEVLTSYSGSEATASLAPVSAARRKAGYEWLFDDSEAAKEEERNLDAELKRMRSKDSA